LTLSAFVFVIQSKKKKNRYTVMPTKNYWPTLTWQFYFCYYTSTTGEI